MKCVQCKNCEYWDTEYPEKFIRWNRELEEALQLRYKGCCNKASSDDGKPIHLESEAVAMDYERYGGNLFTTGEFGCVQGKAKIS